MPYLGAHSYSLINSLLKAGSPHGRYQKKSDTMTHSEPSVHTPKKTWGQRFAALIFFASIVALVYLATTKQAPIVKINNFDKVQHIVAFGWLTFTAFFAWRHSIIKRFCIIFAISGSIEVAQAFISYRTASWEDLVANATGIILAEVLAHSLIRKFKK